MNASTAERLCLFIEDINTCQTTCSQETYFNNREIRRIGQEARYKAHQTPDKRDMWMSEIFSLA